MRTEPQLGRGFRPEEDQAPGRNAVVVLAHRFLGERVRLRSIRNRARIRLDGLDFTVIGVAPESFTGMINSSGRHFMFRPKWRPSILTSDRDLLTNRSSRSFTCQGTFEAGVSLQAGTAEASALAKSLEQSYPATNRGVRSGPTHRTCRRGWTTIRQRP